MALCLSNFSAQLLFYNRGNQVGQRSAKLRNFAHQFCAQITVRLAGQHENSFETWLQFALHEPHLQFVFVIGDGANAPQNYASAALARVIHQQAFEYVDFDGGPLFGDFAEHFDAFGHGEERLLVDILKHGDDHQVEHFLATLDQVEVAVSDGIE